MAIINKVSIANSEIPNYNLLGREITIALYYDRQENVYIESTEGNYVNFFTKVKVRDKSKLQKIFKEIEKKDLSIVSHTYLLFEEYGIDWKESTRLCQVNFAYSKDNVYRLIVFEDDRYVASETQVVKTPNEFADFVGEYYDEIKRNCQEKDNKETQDLLKSILFELKNAGKAGIDIYGNCSNSKCCEIFKLWYLALCDNDKIRELYFECRELQSNYYNAYMTKYR